MVIMVDHNGSERHKRYKQRLANICRRHGYTCFGDRDNELAVQCENETFPYYLDVCAVLGKRVLCIEIDGYQGHKSYRAIRKDKHRTNNIIKYFKGRNIDAEVYRFAFWQLKDSSDELIEQELQLC